MSYKITAVVFAHNQKDLLTNCLKSLKSTAINSLVVVDLGSTEDILTLTKEYQARYILLPKPPNIIEEIRAQVFGQIDSDYILYLDADEKLGQDVLQELVSHAKNDLDYVLIPRQNIVFNTWIKASRWWPDYQVRFFKKDSVTWPTKLHEQPLARGKSGKLDPTPKTAIYHQNYRSLDEWFEKNRRYAKADAADKLASSDTFTLTQAMKLSLSELVSRFFQGQGYLDGMHGLILAIFQSYYYFLVYAYYWEGKKYHSPESLSTLKKFPQNWFRHGLSEILYWDNGNINLFKKIKTKILRGLLS